ncbi:Methylenetetrahydrofolate reductase, putative [Leishmania guyanensis]
MVRTLDAIRQAVENSCHFVSFECVVPTTEFGAVALYDIVERLSALDPLFCSITWGNDGRTAETFIEVASVCQSLLSVNFQVNLTGYTSKLEVLKWLRLLKAKGVRNLLVRRSAPTAGSTTTSCNGDIGVGPRTTAAGSHGTPREEVNATTSTSLAPIATVSSSFSVSAFPHAVGFV